MKRRRALAVCLLAAAVPAQDAEIGGQDRGEWTAARSQAAGR